MNQGTVNSVQENVYIPYFMGVETAAR